MPDVKPVRTDEIAEMKTFVDKDGRKVLEFTPIFAKKVKDRKPIYKGCAKIVANMGNQKMEVNIEFPFEEGISLKQAFKTFDEVAEKEKDAFIKKHREQVLAQQSGLAVPGRPGKGGIILPGQG